MNNYEKILNEVLPEVNFVIDIFEQDPKTFPIFQFNDSYKGDFSEMFQNLMFEEKVLNFLKLLITNKNLRTPQEEELEDFLHYFYSDIKMSLLKDASVNLSDYFFENGNNKKYSKVVDELFYDYNTFKREVGNIAISLGLEENGSLKELFEVIEGYKEQINLKVPKISLPWYAWALSQTYKSLPLYTSGKKVFIINSSSLPLKWLGRSEYSNSNNYVVDAQDKFKVFATTVKNFKDKSANESLNLYLLNEVTNLYDLHNLMDIFKDSSPYMKSEEWTTNTKESNRQNQQRKLKSFKGVSHIAPIKSLGIKTFLINNYYNEDLFTNDEVWGILDKIFLSCKKYLEIAIKESYEKKNENVPEKVQIDYYIYKLLHDEKPYSELTSHLDMQSLNIYTHSQNESEGDLYDAYYYAYKLFYEVRFEKKKIDNLIKY